MRKKLTCLLAVFACVLALTACGGNAAAQPEEIAEDIRNELFSIAETTVQQMDTVVTSGLVDQQKDNEVIYSGLQSWESAKKETGDVDFSKDTDGNGIADCFEEKSIIVDDEGSYIVTVGVTGAQKTADCVVTFNKDISDYRSIVTNVNYTSSELMQQAGMNTILGMGTTFAVLILLSLIIAAFGKILAAYSRKKAEAEHKKEEEEQKSSAGSAGGASASPEGPCDGELVAVIAAAVAAYREETEPSADPGAFVVRRIRRVRSR